MINPEFGVWLQGELKKRKIRQSDLARLLGVATSHVANILYGKRGVSTELATKLADTLGISESEVFLQAGISTERPLYSAFTREIMKKEGDLTDDDKADVLALIDAKASRRKRITENAQ